MQEVTMKEVSVIGIFHRIIKSVAFNIAMLITGFCVGFGYVALDVHYNAMKNENYECLTQIQEKVQELDRINVERGEKYMEIIDLIGDLKIRLSHQSSKTDIFINKSHDSK